MFEFSKKILRKVSFDRRLFRKELLKAIKAVSKEERIALQSWCLISFADYQGIITDCFGAVS